MKLVIERSSLLKSLGHVQNVVEARNTIPILANVKLHAEGDALHLTGTDMDLTLASDEPARVAREGQVTVAARTLFEIVRKLPDGAEVEMDHEPGSNEMKLAAGRSTFTLPTLPADEFPAMTSEDLDVRFEIPASDLKKLIDKTRFAISTEETRYYLNGVYLHAAKSGATSALRGVATDGHRLARVEVALPQGAEDMPAIIVPRKTVAEARKLCDGVDGAVKVAISPNRIRFEFERAVLASRLIDGTFPDYERVIPSGNDRTAELEAGEFGKAVDRVATISTERARAVKLSFAQGGVTVSAVSAEAGRAVEELDARFEGETLEIGFNARYINDMIAEIDGERVRFEMANAAAPTLVRDPGDGSTLYVLMPMRV